MDHGHRSWFQIVGDLIGNIIENVSNTVQKSIENRRKVMVKYFFGGFLAIVGILFFLNGMAKLVNVYVGRESWIGYTGVGAITALIGIIIFKSK